MASSDPQFWWNAVKVRQLMTDRANEELERLSGYVQNYMQTTVPVRTGALFHSISYVHDWANLRSRFTVGMPYAVYVEFGTRYMAPRPFIRPALLSASQFWKLGKVEIEIHPPPQRAEPLRAHTRGFRRPKIEKLTWRQEKHVRANLVSVSRRYADEFKQRKIRFKVSGPK